MNARQLITSFLFAAVPALVLAPNTASAQSYGPYYPDYGYVRPDYGSWSEGQYRSARRIIEDIRAEYGPIHGSIRRSGDVELITLADRIAAEAEALSRVFALRGGLDAVEIQYHAFGDRWNSLAEVVGRDSRFAGFVQNIDQLNRSLVDMIGNRAPSRTTTYYRGGHDYRAYQPLGRPRIEIRPRIRLF